MNRDNGHIGRFFASDQIELGENRATADVRHFVTQLPWADYAELTEFVFLRGQESGGHRTDRVPVV